MVKSRLDLLLEYHQQAPDDPFTIYGIALEYLNHDILKAKKYFDILLSNFSDYLPSYYHAAKLYENLNQPEKAKLIYIKGLEISKKQQNQHTTRELQNALNLLLFEEEED